MSYTSWIECISIVESGNMLFINKSEVQGPISEYLCTLWASIDLSSRPSYIALTTLPYKTNPSTNPTAPITASLRSFSTPLLAVEEVTAAETLVEACVSNAEVVVAIDVSVLAASLVDVTALETAEV